MPLSQGYCVKPSSLGAKKRVLKVLRKEQHDQEQQQHHQHHRLHHTQPHNVGVQCYLAGDDDDDSSQSSLHLSYLVGESFAKIGSLPKAFDVYELIASRQCDGHVPLNKLNVLASALTSHFRQMGGVATNPATANPGTTALKSPRLEMMHWSRYHHQDKLNQGSEFLPGARESPNESFGAASPLDLHSPTRELRVPSPLQDPEDYDPLLCPLCNDILRCPVTTNCGHTFCRQCCETITQCNICQVRFPRMQDSSPPCALTTTTTTASSGPAVQSSFFAAAPTSAHNNANLGLMSFPVGYGVQLTSSVHHLAAAPMTVTTTTVASTTATATTTMASTSAAAALGLSGYTSGHNGGGSSAMKFMPDVLVRRLVEKWWGPDLQAKKISEKASSCMHLNLLDDALKFCNASLEKAPANFKSLCLRAEVLLKLSHYQSSLADIENALRTRCTSPKAHYLRALALSGLGRLEEALYNGFLAICLDKNTNLSNSEIFQHDLAKILQRLLAQMPKTRCSVSAAAHPGVQQQHRSYASSRQPYPLLWEQVTRRRKQQHHHHHHLHHHHHHVHLDDVEDEFGHYDNYIMAGDDMEDEVEVEVDGGEPGSLHLDGDFLFPSALDYMDHHRHQRHVFEQKQFDLQPRRHANRKHCKRKWSAAMGPLSGRVVEEEENVDQTEVVGGGSQRCSRLFTGILERTQQELQRLRKLDGTGPSAQLAVSAVAGQLIDASDFDCVVCCRTLWKPVVTPCGHTYCLVCLDRCMDYNSPCPLCMSPLVEFNVNASASASASASQNQNQIHLHPGSSSPVPFALAKRPVTKFLEAAMKRFIPDHYEARFRQEIDQEPSVPVFICTTAFPAVPCPLFVCEPRYRLMVRRAVESGDKTFGIVQPNSGKSRYYDVGTILDIRDCVQLGDGCSILSTIGCKRFKILARNEKDGYETAKVEYICDEPIAEEQVKILAGMQGVVLAKASGWFESLSTEQKHEILQSYGQMPPLEPNWELISDGPAWAWWVIALLPLSQQLKVDILATTSLEKRLRAIDKTLDWLHDLRHPQQPTHHHHHHQQAPQSPQQAHHHLDLDCEEQETASSGADECCLFAETGSEPHTDEELLL